MSAARGPLREPMMWLVIGLPAASVIAGVALVIVAVRTGGGDEVRETVRRTSQIQQADISPDLVARRLGLSMHMRLDGQTVELRPVGHVPPDAALRLTLAHPAQAAQDLTLQLLPEDGLWRAQAGADFTHDWNLQLAPGDGSWRLSGRLPGGETSAMLLPALPPP